MSALFVGIAVCKVHLDCSMSRSGVKEGSSQRFLNTPERIEELSYFLVSLQVTLFLSKLLGD